jgi:hypothetical protein
LVISVITMVMLYQNSSFNDIFCLGTFGCESENKPYLFFFKRCIRDFLDSKRAVLTTTRC